MKECVLILDNLRSVENTASIFRTSDCFGVSKIFLIGTTPAPVDRFGRKREDFAKVALGAESTMEWEYLKEIKPLLKNLKEEGYQIVALEQDSRSEPLSGFKPSDRFALVAGSEVLGVSKEVLNTADNILEIPMMGVKESLNVSVAVGVTLYSLVRKVT